MNRLGLMLTVLGGLAKFERELIRSRTSEGRGRGKGEKTLAETTCYYARKHANVLARKFVPPPSLGR